MCKIKKKISQSFHSQNFCVILEIIQYAIFTKIVANNDNEIFYYLIWIVIAPKK